MTTDADTVTASTQNFSLKSEVGEDGQEREYVTGFLATTHEDKGNDQFTEQALRGMAEDINDDTVDAVFNDVDMDALREAQVGNLDHNNNPASPFGDTRTVPAFKIQKAEVRSMEDGEKGLHVKAMLNSDGMMSETVSAVKNSIKDNFLNAFSVEFIPEKVRQKVSGDKVVRVIQKAAAKGAALTGRPMNPMAQMTNAQLKSLTQEYKVEYAYDIGDEVEWGETSGTVRDRTKDSCFNEEIDGDFEVCGEQEEPAYLIEVDNDEGTMVGHKQDTLSAKSQHVKAELSEEQRTPPQAAQENAQMFLDAKEEDKVGEGCGTGAGTNTAEMLVEGEPLSEDKISDIASFARHEDNKEADVEEDESKWTDCGYAMWKAWGGDEGVRWAQDKNEMSEKTQEIDTKVADPVIQTPEYEATGEGKWSAPAASDFPDDYNTNSIFVVAEEGSDNFSDHALPVVDYRNDEPTLVLEALRSAHELAAQVDGLDEDGVMRAREQIAQLADEEFDVMLGRDEDTEHNKNDINAMTDEVEEPEPEEEVSEEEAESEVEGGDDEPSDEGEGKSESLADDVEELKSVTQDLKETNEGLREENEELKSELEDLRQLQEIKSEVDEVKSILDEVELEDGPRVRQEQKRFEEDQETKAEWKQAADRLGKDYLQSKNDEYIEAFSENHEIDTEEVKNYVNTD
jgi:hypothetical protein